MEVDDGRRRSVGRASRWAATCLDKLVARAQLLDIAAAALGEVRARTACGTTSRGRTGPRRVDGLLVADLSSLWAGPLCAQLLARAGAIVVKVESRSRPDGTRRGEPAFFDWMNSGKLCYTVDFDNDSDALRRLLAAADIVIEGSRPAALRRRALSADDMPGRPRTNLVAHQRVSRPAEPTGIRRRRRGRRRAGRRGRRRTGVLRGRDRRPAERTGGGPRGGGVGAPRRRRGDRRVDGPGRRDDMRHCRESTDPATPVDRPRYGHPAVRSASPLGADNAAVDAWWGRDSARHADSACNDPGRCGRRPSGGRARSTRSPRQWPPGAARTCWTRPAGPCCPACTTTTCTCIPRRPRRTRSRSGRRRYATAPRLAAVLDRRRGRRRRLDPRCRLPRFGGRAAGSRRAGRDGRDRAAARPASQRRAVDPQLGGSGPRRSGRAPGRRLRSADSWSDALTRSATNLAALSARLSSYGVTGITDATPDLDVADIVRSESCTGTANCVNRCTAWRRANGSCTTTT